MNVETRSAELFRASRCALRVFNDGGKMQRNDRMVFGLAEDSVPIPSKSPELPDMGCPD